MVTEIDILRVPVHHRVYVGRMVSLGESISASSDEFLDFFGCHYGVCTGTHCVSFEVTLVLLCFQDLNDRG